MKHNTQREAFLQYTVIHFVDYSNVCFIISQL